MATVEQRLSALEHATNHRHLSTTATNGDLDTFFLMVCGVFVFFMQAGFALLEAGSVRAKNTKNILMKNLLDACIGALIWGAWGYGLAVRAHPPAVQSLPTPTLHAHAPPDACACQATDLS